MQLRFIDEHNDRGHLLWAEEPVGLALRGETQQAALSKLPTELTAGGECPYGPDDRQPAPHGGDLAARSAGPAHARISCGGAPCGWQPARPGARP